MIFINPDCYHGYRSPSIGMLYMAAVLERGGLPVEYIDPNYESGWEQRLDEAAKQHKWAGISANILSIKPAMETAEYVRNRHPDLKIVMGGPYPSVKYRELIPHYADAVAVGESEATCLDIVGDEEPENIPGLAWGGNGDVQYNGPRPLIEDLDSLPFPAWHMGNVPSYVLEHTKKNPVLPVITSRGCPFKCIFCASRIIFSNRIRYRSLDAVMEEIDGDVERHGAREIHIWDDNFTLRRERVIEFCEKLIERNHVGLSLMIPAGIKPDVGDYEMSRLMLEAGFYAVCVAAETGDQEIMNRLGKKVNVDKVRGVVFDARRAGLMINGFFMLGLPYDTEETMLRNIRHACSLPIHQAMFFVTIPFPGTELYDMVKEKGKFLFHNDERLYEEGYFLGRASYEMPGFDAETLERMYRLANRTFYMRPYTLLVLILKRIYSPIHIFFLARKWFRVLLRGRQF